MNEEEIRKTLTLASIHAILCCVYDLLSRSFMSFELMEDKSSQNEISAIIDKVYDMNTKIGYELVVREKELNKACGNN